MKKVLFILILMVSSVGWSQTKDTNLDPTHQEGLLIPPGLSEFENGGYGVGNGGDFVRARFIKAGFEIIDFLTNHDEGIAFTTTYNINVFAFSSILNTHVVLPTDEKPTDNRGHKVDAVFKNGNLYLYVPTWEKFLSSRDEMYLMVFHEMLRVTGHFDDSYVISRNLTIPSDLKLSDKPPKSSNYIVCVCSQDTEYSVKLLCVESQSQKTVIDVKFDGNSHSSNQKARFELCEKQRKNVLNQYGLPDQEEGESDFDFSIIGYGGDLGWEKPFNYKIDMTFLIKGYSEKFGLRCSSLWGKYYLVSASGAYWDVSHEVCDGLSSALLLGTESNPVEIFFKDDVVEKFHFKP